MSLKLAARLVALEPHKYIGVQENDTVAHILDMSDILPPGTIAILIRAVRTSGTGAFNVYPRSHATITVVADSSQTGAIPLIPVKNRELKWINTVANDAWDLYMFGYFVQRRIR